jgi:fructose-specific component phosphotransferase system IIB-like protein
MVCPPQAPVHELGRQIQIVNAYLRDASSTTAKKRKYQEIQDEQDLAHLLDDLIAAHSQLKPDSIYTLSVKSSIWATAEVLEEALLEAIPRLVERDKEMIMIPKVLRR